MKYILLVLLLNGTVQAQCKFRLINQTESNLHIKMDRLGIDTMLKPNDTTKYFTYDSIQKREQYFIEADEEWMESDPARSPAYLKAGLWELCFRWSDKRKVFFSVLNQNQY